MAKYGLKGPHATYLTEIVKYPDGITVPELCAACGKDLTGAEREQFYKALDSITANLRKMCEDGIPARSPLRSAEKWYNS